MVIKDIIQGAADLSEDYHNARDEMEDAKKKLVKNHANFTGSLDDEILKDVAKLRPLLQVVEATKTLAFDEEKKLNKKSDDQSELQMECKALEALLASELLKKEEKNSLENFDNNSKKKKVRSASYTSKTNQSSKKSKKPYRL